MVAGIRTRDLRKVYNSAPPVARRHGRLLLRGAETVRQRAQAQIVALDGISLDIQPGEIFCLLARTEPASPNRRVLTRAFARPAPGLHRRPRRLQRQVAVKHLIGVVPSAQSRFFPYCPRSWSFHGAYFGLLPRTPKRAEPSLSVSAHRSRRPDVRGFSVA